MSCTNMEAQLSHNIDLSQGYTNVDVELQADLSQLNYELTQFIFKTILHIYLNSITFRYP